MLSILIIFLNLSYAEDTIIKIVLKDQKIIPEKIEINTNESFWLEIENTDNTTEEIESLSLNIEKMIPPKRKVKIKIKGQKNGIYDLFGEFHQNTSQAKIHIQASPIVAP